MPGSASKKYSSWLTGPAVLADAEVIKKDRDSVMLYPRLFFARMYKVWKPAVKEETGITLVFSDESAAGETVIFVPEPTPGSVSKKYSSWLMGPAVLEAEEIIKNERDSVMLYPRLFLARM